MPTAPQLQFEAKLRDDLSGQLSMYEKAAAITAAFLARDAGYCGWTPRAGRWIDLNWTRDWYVHPEDAWWEH